MITGCLVQCSHNYRRNLHKIVRHHAVAKPEGSGGKGIGHSCVYRGVVAETVHAREEVDGGHGGGAEDEGQVLIVSYVLKKDKSALYLWFRPLYFDIVKTQTNINLTQLRLRLDTIIPNPPT